MIRAGIDIGTNTILMVIADVRDGIVFSVLEDVHALPRLGSGVDASGQIADASIVRAEEVMRRYRAILDQHGKPPTYCVATSALRDATNRSVVLQRLEAALGEHILVIDGETEAQLTYLGTAGAGSTNSTICDIGGGSTELVDGGKGLVLQRVSLNVGSVRLTERWCQERPVPQNQQDGLQDDIRSALATSGFQPDISEGELTVVAGTGTALAMLSLGLTAFDPDVLEGHILEFSDVKSLAKQLIVTSGSDLQQLPGIDPGRSDILPAGALILQGVMEFLGRERVRVSTRGLRFGALLSSKACFNGE